MTNWTRKFTLIVALLGSISVSVAGAVASTPTSGITAADEQKEIVEYQLDKWKTAHASDDAAAKKMVATLKQLKCEVKTDNHGGHIDITYRCPQWKRMTLKDHKTAHQWEAWLKKYGFSTKHTH